MNNLMLKKIALAVSIFVAAPIVVQAAEIFDPSEQLQHGKEMVDGANLKEKRKLDLEIAILNNEISNLDGTNQKLIDDAVKKATIEIEKKYALQVQLLEKQVDSLRDQNKRLTGQLGGASDEVDDVFFTGVIEIGKSRKAEVIVGGSRSLVSVGETIMPGMTVVAIESNKLVVSTGAGNRSFPIKSSAQIASRIYESALQRVQGERNGSKGGDAVKIPNSRERD